MISLGQNTKEVTSCTVKVLIMVAPRLMSVCLGALLLQLVQGGLARASATPSRSMLLDVKGHKVGLTYYDPRSRDIQSERRSFDVGVLKRLGEIINDIVEDTLIKRKFTIMLAPYSRELLSLINDSKKKIDELVDTGKSQDFKPSFVKDSMKALREALDTKGDPERVAAMLRQKPRVVQEKIKDLLELYKDIVEASPIGLYYDWSKLTIDGDTLTDIVPPYVKYFKKNGYSFVVSMMSPVISVIEKLR